MNEKLDEAYVDLLKAFDSNIQIGELDINHPHTELDATLRCCGEVEVGEGVYVCSECGKVLQVGVVENDYTPAFSKSYRHEFQKPLGSDEHWYTERRRHYHPKTHFKQHLNCYLGARKRHIPKPILNSLAKIIDLEDRQAFIQVRQWLKEKGKISYYKDTFTILYQLGAPVPIFTRTNEVLDEFNYWYNNFKTQGRFGGYNTPSMQMLLTIFLRRNGHEPYYAIPELKSKKLRERVYMIDEEVRSVVELRQALYDVKPVNQTFTKRAPVSQTPSSSQP